MYIMNEQNTAFSKVYFAILDFYINYESLIGLDNQATRKQPMDAQNKQTNIKIKQK